MRSTTVSRSLSSRPFCSCNAFRVAPANAGGWRNGSAVPTASLPITPIAESTARSGPMTMASAASSWATSCASRSSSTASSLNPKSITHGGAVGVDEQVGAPQVAVRDALTPQQRNLFPDAAQQLVAPRLRNPIERRAFDRLVREEQPVGLDRSRRSAGGACERRRRAPSSARSASCSTDRRNVENGRSSPTFFRTRYR